MQMKLSENQMKCNLNEVQIKWSAIQIKPIKEYMVRTENRVLVERFLQFD